jgi:hypothetical protein
MKHIRKFESFQNKIRREQIIKESVIEVDDLYKVRTTVDIPQSLINAYVKKVKEVSGKNLRQYFGDVDIAEEIVKYLTVAGLDVEKIPGNAILGGPQAQQQAQQGQTQQGQAQTGQEDGDDYEDVQQGQGQQGQGQQGQPQQKAQQGQAQQGQGQEKAQQGQAQQGQGQEKAQQGQAQQGQGQEKAQQGQAQQGQGQEKAQQGQGQQDEEELPEEE